MVLPVIDVVPAEDTIPLVIGLGTVPDELFALFKLATTLLEIVIVPVAAFIIPANCCPVGEVETVFKLMLLGVEALPMVFPLIV